MKLYFSPGACSLSPRIVLREAGLDFSTEQVDLRTKQTAGGADYRLVNPKGVVPALMLKDGAVLTEGPAIIQFLADLVPEKNLAPVAGSFERYRLAEWLNYIGTEVHKSFSPLFNRAASQDTREAAIAVLATRFDFLARSLEGRDYLMGERFTVADAYLFTVLGWCGFTNVDLAQWPVLHAFHARVGMRPAVQQALSDEGLNK
ncbi:glutathione transferase GstA [Massilia soli]|uniref:Glutathione transferase GstA n=1 Tax=Massilia soli TaxID=2792854 RepID=A0ABS7SND5_9BURK|nr:glutathione transferase GstA [Massilia soli]MBZ2207700.1 glutathione transferase GstA [Massilia soli]